MKTIGSDENIRPMFFYPVSRIFSFHYYIDSMNRLMTDTSDPLQCVAQTRLIGELIPRVVSGCDVRQTPTPSFSLSVGRQVGGGVCRGVAVWRVDRVGVNRMVRLGEARTV